MPEATKQHCRCKRASSCPTDHRCTDRIRLGQMVVASHGSNLQQRMLLCLVFFNLLWCQILLAQPMNTSTTKLSRIAAGNGHLDINISSSSSKINSNLAGVLHCLTKLKSLLTCCKNGMEVNPSSMHLHRFHPVVKTMRWWSGC